MALRAYIAGDDPHVAARVSSAILTAVERLATLPRVGRPGRLEGTRELVVPRTPYLVPYRIKATRCRPACVPWRPLVAGALVSAVLALRSGHRLPWENKGHHRAKPNILGSHMKVSGT
jgi:hypothetical protein